jgi:hypothetical protein
MMAKVEKIKTQSKRGRPVLLNDVLKQAIILYKSSNPGWSAKKILDSIKAGYFIKIKRAHPDWPDSKIREQAAFPGVNRIQRYLKEISPLLNQKSPLQEKWHLGTMNDYPVTPEAVKKIFELKARGKDYISIRIARWISRLSALPLPVDILYLSAMEYSTAEEIAEISRTPLNTANMDAMLLENIKNAGVKGNGSKKANEIPVKKSMPPVKAGAMPVKIEVAPLKKDIIPVEADVEPEEDDIGPDEDDITPEENNAAPVKIDAEPDEADVVPGKSEISTEQKEAVSPDNKAVKQEKKEAIERKEEERVPEDKPGETLRKWHLPDMRERQSNINEFLKFVEKHKDIEL